MWIRAQVILNPSIWVWWLKLVIGKIWFILVLFQTTTSLSKMYINGVNDVPYPQDADGPLESLLDECLYLWILVKLTPHSTSYTSLLSLSFNVLSLGRLSFCLGVVFGSKWASLLCLEKIGLSLSDIAVKYEITTFLCPIFLFLFVWCCIPFSEFLADLTTA